MSSSTSSPNVLNIALWAAQILIAAAFGWGGIVKLTTPIPRLASMWSWTADLPEPVVRSLGGVDLAGGIGVLLPALLGIWPGLTPIAALCCVALQVCAMVFHLSRGEASVLPVNVVFFVVCAFIAWGRWKGLPSG